MYVIYFCAGKPQLLEVSASHLLYISWLNKMKVIVHMCTYAYVQMMWLGVSQCRFRFAAPMIASSCVVLLVFIISYLSSGFVCFITRFHSLRNPVSVHFTLGWPDRRITFPLSVILIGVSVSYSKVVCLMGLSGGSSIILFSRLVFLSSYTVAYVLSCFSGFPILVLLCM